MIDLILGERASGKTEALIQWLNDDPSRRVIVATRADAQRYVRAGISKGRVAVAGAVRMCRDGGSVAVDDIDVVLHALLPPGWNVTTATLTPRRVSSLRVPLRVRLRRRRKNLVNSPARRRAIGVGMT